MSYAIAAPRARSNIVSCGTLTGRGGRRRRELVRRARLAPLAAVLGRELALLAREARGERAPARVIDLAVLERVRAVDLLEAARARAAVHAVLRFVDDERLAAQRLALARPRAPQAVVLVLRAPRLVVAGVGADDEQDNGNARCPHLHWSGATRPTD